MILKIIRSLLLFLIFINSVALAIKEPKPMAVDKRLGILVY